MTINNSNLKSDTSNDAVKICFLGGGNMARSIIGGMVEKGLAGTNIIVADPNKKALEQLREAFGVRVCHDNREALQNCDALVLATKPQVMESVCEEIAPRLESSTLVISIAAGISTPLLKRWLNRSTAIVRCMPNTPALVHEGASVLFADADLHQQQRDIAENVLASVGITRWVENESLMDAVTAVSGSGPAYFFLFIEAMVDAGIKQGLSKALARDLALQTALGAAKLAIESEDDVAELRRKVTSPNGTTERAIESFESDDLRGCVDRAMKACADRSLSLGEELGS